mmetsp:Transcript_30676/g.71344  ORF Transcript_30676/g.71344 Transcript_30676/m.71344 type:complete len:444 (-) Transcript_30676:382-1713(-)
MRRTPRTPVTDNRVLGKRVRSQSQTACNQTTGGTACKQAACCLRSSCGASERSLDGMSGRAPRQGARRPLSQLVRANVDAGAWRLKDKSVAARRHAALRLAGREAHVATANNVLAAFAASTAMRLEPATAGLRRLEGTPRWLSSRRWSAPHRIDERRRRGGRVVVVQLSATAKPRPLLVPRLHAFLAVRRLRLRHLPLRHTALQQFRLAGWQASLRRMGATNRRCAIGTRQRRRKLRMHSERSVHADHRLLLPRELHWRHLGSPEISTFLLAAHTASAEPFRRRLGSRQLAVGPEPADAPHELLCMLHVRLRPSFPARAALHTAPPPLHALHLLVAFLVTLTIILALVLVALALVGATASLCHLLARLTRTDGAAPLVEIRKLVDLVERAHGHVLGAGRPRAFSSPSALVEAARLRLVYCGMRRREHAEHPQRRRTQLLRDAL